MQRTCKTVSIIATYFNFTRDFFNHYKEQVIHQTDVLVTRNYAEATGMFENKYPASSLSVMNSINYGFSLSSMLAVL